jgi:hypothetical protein
MDRPQRSDRPFKIDGHRREGRPHRSINPLGGAVYNSENLNLVASPTIAAAYAGHWHQRLALSLPYTQREDWCRRPEVADFKSASLPR